MLAQFLEHVEAVHDRHGNIQQDDVGTVVAEGLDGLARVIDDADVLLPGGGEADLDGAGAYRLVIDDEEAGALEDIFRMRASGLRRWPRA